MMKDKGKAIVAIQQVKHNRTEICEIKHVSQLHEKVAHATLVKNQKIMPAKVHVQNCRNTTSVSTTICWGTDKYFVNIIYLIRRITCQANTVKWHKLIMYSLWKSCPAPNLVSLSPVEAHEICHPQPAYFSSTNIQRQKSPKDIGRRCKWSKIHARWGSPSSAPA